MTLLLYAQRNEWALKNMEVDLAHDRVYVDGGENGAGQLERYTLDVRLIGDIDGEQRDRLACIATRCPVRRTLAAVPHFQETVAVVPG
jgi:uncharacterized OsmC-like protein